MIGCDITMYKLTVGASSGTAGDALSQGGNEAQANMQFSTYDNDHDTTTDNCALKLGG
jgi:hypothetical protein